MAPNRFKDFWRGYLRLALAALTRTNRRVHMLEQSVRALALRLLELGWDRQCRSFGRSLNHFRPIARLRRSSIHYRLHRLDRGL